MRSQVFLFPMVLLAFLLVLMIVDRTAVQESLHRAHLLIWKMYKYDVEAREYELSYSLLVETCVLNSTIYSQSAEELEERTRSCLMEMLGNDAELNLVPREDHIELTFKIPEKEFGEENVRIKYEEKYAQKSLSMPFLSLVSYAEEFDWDALESCLSGYDCSNFREGLENCLEELSDEGFVLNYTLGEVPCVNGDINALIFVYKGNNSLSKSYPHFLGKV